ncbi:MAG: hypothetical protein ACI936_001714 [Paraglaciecola sp.]|jgi:hypothetical protein
MLLPFLKNIIAFTLLATSVPIFAYAYWADIDVTSLKDQATIYVENKSEHNLRCSVSAFNDKVWLEIRAGEKSGAITLIEGVRFFELALYCKKVARMTKTNPWRINHFLDRSYKRQVIFFPPKGRKV